jgi:hypothetical protein
MGQNYYKKLFKKLNKYKPPGVSAPIPISWSRRKYNNAVSRAALGGKDIENRNRFYFARLSLYLVCKVLRKTGQESRIR